VLQALYFSEPFRELVINSPDRSYLYPPQPPLVTGPIFTQPAASTSAKPAAKVDSKAGTSGHKRPTSSSYGDAKGESSSKTDTDDNNIASTGPPMSIQPPSLFSALRSLFIHISQHTLDKGTVAPQAFIAKLRKENELFRSTMHQDAHEFLNYLVNSVVENIEEEEKLLRQKERSTGETEKSATLTAPTANEDC
jgi:ubiquitin carboxyl-terminal hydrolase 9/13